ncbi:hypothetical protein MRX96_043096 [Rhipicephalus microplus]
MVQDQILHGLLEPDLLRSFVQIEDAFTVQTALEHVREEERVNHALQQLAALQADSITRCEHQRHGVHPPGTILLQHYATNPAVPSAPPRLRVPAVSTHWAVVSTPLFLPRLGPTVSPRRFYRELQLVSIRSCLPCSMLTPVALLELDE